MRPSVLQEIPHPLTDAAEAGGDGPAPGRWLGDAVSLALLSSLFYLVVHDGGFETELPALTRVGWVALAASPALILEAARLGRPGRILVAGWGLGALVALIFALERSGFVHPTLTYALMPMMGLAAARVWRRPWGPVVIGGVLVLVLGRAWLEAFLAWWGSLLGGSPSPRWAALSWHNQSGTLMAGLGVFLLGPAALAPTRTWRWMTAAGAVGGLAGAWLAGSRGGVLAGLLGVMVIALVVARGEGRGRALARLGGVLAGAAVLSLALLAMGSGDRPVGQPLAARAEPASLTLRLRLDHMRAALGMFADRPLTGWGPGSYRRVAPEFTSPDAYLTSTAHSEPVEALAEGGLGFGVPVLALYGLAGGLVVVTVGDRRRREGDRGAWTVGAAGATAVLLIHAGLDFDWLYPLLAFLAVVGVGVLGAGAGEQPAEQGMGRWAALPVVVLLTVGLAGASAGRVVDGPLPWDSASQKRTAVELARQGRVEAAGQVLERAASWSPGDPDLEAFRAVIAYRAGELGPSRLRASLDPGRPRFGMSNLVAEMLMEGGDLAEARALLEETIAAYPRYRARQPQEHVRTSWLLLIRLEAEAGDCRAATSAAGRAAEDPLIGGAEAARALGELAEVLCGPPGGEAV